MALDIKDIIINGSARAYRKMFMKRLQNDGTYESEWQEITKYVTSWGSIKVAYGDETFLGEYKIDGFNFELENSTQKFSDEKNPNSLFYQYRTRYRTKFKLDIGYYDDVSNETLLLDSDGKVLVDSDGDKLTVAGDNDGQLEIDGRRWYGILYSNPKASSTGRVNFSLAPLIKVLQNYKATGIDTTSGTTAELVDRLVKLEISGERVFDRYFEGDTDADKYKINPRSKSVTTIETPLITDRDTVWDKIVKYSIYDDFMCYVDKNGALVFDNKDEKDEISWIFNGAGTIDNEYGVTIVGNRDLVEEEDIDNLWTRIAIEYDDDLYAVSEQSWVPGDESTPDIYGERIFDETFHELDQAEAQTIANTLRANYGAIKYRYTVPTIFIPQLDLNDYVEINSGGDILPTNVFVLGVSLLGGTDVLGLQTGAISLRGQKAKIVSIEINVDNFECNFSLREV